MPSFLLLRSGGFTQESCNNVPNSEPRKMAVPSRGTAILSRPRDSIAILRGRDFNLCHKSRINAI